MRSRSSGLATFVRFTFVLVFFVLHVSLGQAQTCPIVTAVEADGTVSFAVKSDGSVWLWGGGLSGSSYTPPSPFGGPAPVAIVGISGATSVQVGHDFVVVLRGDGTVRGWGNNANGQLGTGGTNPGNVWPPVMAGVPPMASVVAGFDHVVALSTTGAVWTWGGNSAGQLGLGFTSDWEAPSQVLSGAVAVTCGGSSTFAILNDGTVRGWGFNSTGQLGDGSFDSTAAPVVVTGLSGAQKIASGAAHTVALKTDGTVYAWGSNGSGELGLGSTGPSVAVPTQVPGLTAVADVNAHVHGTLARRSGGSVLGWGANWSGRLGIGNLAIDGNVPVPTQVVGLSSAVVDMNLSWTHALFVEAGGHVLGCGDNSTGQTGNTATPFVPTESAITANTLGPCPMISSVSITHSSLFGGVPLTITGGNFTSATLASVGATPIASPLLIDAHTITGQTPAIGTPGAMSVSVSTGAGTSTLPNAITYDHAALNAIGAPHVGGSFEVRISSYPSKPLIFLGDQFPGPTPIGIYGSVGIAMSSAMVVVLDYFGAFTHVPDPSAVLGATGQWSAFAAIPNDPAFIGQTIYGQAYVFSFAPFPANTLFFPTNTLAVTLQP